MLFRPGRPRIAVLYLTFFSAVGISLPFFPQYLRSLGFKGWQIGTLLSVAPAMTLIAPPFWGQLADRTGRPGRVAAIVLSGATLGYFAIAAAPTFENVFLALIFHAAFSSAVTSMVDTVALRQIHKDGGKYASLRIFGSIGFVMSSLAIGFWIDAIDIRVVYATTGCFAVASIFAWATVAQEPEQHFDGPKPSFGATWELLKNPRVWGLLVATACHWIACAPYHGTFSIHVTALNLPPWVVSMSSALAVTSEVGVMYLWARRDTSLPTALFASFIASSVRWLAMSLSSSPWVLASLALLHGLTFGAFYLAAVEWMAREAPGSLRASGQALLATATFGIGGTIGYAATGVLLDDLGTHRLFAIAAGLEIIPCLLLVKLIRTGSRQAG